MEQSKAASASVSATLLNNRYLFYREVEEKWLDTRPRLKPKGHRQDQYIPIDSSEIDGFSRRALALFDKEVSEHILTLKGQYHRGWWYLGFVDDFEDKTISIKIARYLTELRALDSYYRNQNKIGLDLFLIMKSSVSSDSDRLSYCYVCDGNERKKEVKNTSSREFLNIFKGVDLKNRDNDIEIKNKIKNLAIFNEDIELPDFVKYIADLHEPSEEFKQPFFEIMCRGLDKF